ncbi:MAG: MFS transporter [Bryobacteraceae bacterium]|nr:MAG: MFS transporter [Bryobacteraceae bacterium]
MEAADAPSFSFAAYLRLLADNRDFRLLWIAQVVSELGDWLYAVAIYSLLLQLTGRAESVGIAVVLQLLPQVLVAPTAGVLNDRLRRRAIMISADIARIFIVLGMMMVTSAGQVWIVWVLLFLETVMWALFEPGRTALIPNIVTSKDQLLVANALSSSTWAINLALGSGLGGLLLWKFGRTAVFLLNAVSFLVSALLLSAMRVRETHADSQPPFRLADLFDFRPMWEGIQYVRGHAGRLSTLLVKAGMGLTGAHWVLLPVFGERVFPIEGSGALSMSLLFSARGVGAFIGSFASGYWARNDERKMRTGIQLAFLMTAAAYAALGFAPTLWLACVCVAIGHAGGSMAWVFSTTLLHRITDDEFRGRVFSADFAGLFLVMSAVSYAAGELVDLGVPVRTLAVCSGLLGLVPALVWSLAERRGIGQPAAAQRSGD